MVTSSSLPLSQIQREPTRQDSLLDLFFTNNVSLVSSIKNVIGVSTADEHDALVTNLKLKAQISNSAPRKIHQWSKAVWSSIKNETLAFAAQFDANSTNWSVDQQWDSIEKHLNEMVDKFIPTKDSKSRSDQPWITPS